MKDSLEFVATLGTPNELVPKDEVVHIGSHSDNILKESLRPNTKYKKIKNLPSPFVLSTSFSDILPPIGKQMLEKSEAIFVRGEFLALRTKTFSTEETLEVVEKLAKASPNIIYYRLMDYNTTEFDFLPYSKKFASLRGSGRLLADPKLLDRELAVVRKFEAMGKKVRVIIPYVSSPAEQTVIQKLITNTKPDQIGVMVEHIKHAQNIKDYPYCDFLFPGPSDLTADHTQIERGDYREGIDADNDIIRLVQTLADQGLSIGIKNILTIKILVGNITSTKSGYVKEVYMPNQLIIQD